MIDRPPPQRNASALKVALLCVGYAVVHSLLASGQAKRLVRKVVGVPYYDGLYRTFFVGHATAATVLTVRTFLRLPDREIYHAPKPWSDLLGAVQVAGLALLARAISVVGWSRISGIENASALLSGRVPPPAPEAQGPPPRADGTPDARGPFRLIRHPDNLPIILVLCAFPRMTVNRLTLAVISSVYAVLGSWHEDRRLRAAYGDSFAEYSRRVPLMIPRFRGELRSPADPPQSIKVDDPREDLAVRHERVRGDRVDLHVVRYGEGPPVILLHGFPENWRSWRHQIGALAAAGFTVWAPDLRGYNLSDRPQGCDAYRLRHLVEDVAAIVRHTGYAWAHIVGHDWGGIVAWTFAGVHPEFTAKLVILNAPHMRIYLREVSRPPQMLQSWYVLFFQLPWIPEFLLRAGDFHVVRQMFRRTPARRGAFSDHEIDQYVDSLAQPGALRAALNYYRANFRSDGLRLAASAQIEAETLVIWGEKDPALSRRLLNGLEEVAPRVQVHRIPSAGHWVQNEAPGEVNEALLRFLNEVWDRPAKEAKGNETGSTS